MDKFKEKCPDRFFDVGIAEEHAVLMAAGMACKDLRPVCAIYSTFLQRAYDPIIHDVCLQNLPVTFCLDRAGLSPNDGPTHHGLFDLSYLNCIPNALIMQPRHENELQDMLFTGVHCGKPSFIRYPRGQAKGVEVSNTPKLLDIGKAEVLSKGEHFAIWAIGDFVDVANEINLRIQSTYGFKCTVVNARFVKPLDADLLLNHAKHFKHIVTLEDNVLKGGFGSSVLECVQDATEPPKVHSFGWPDEFIPHGSSVKQLRQAYGLDLESIYSKLESTILMHLPSVARMAG